MARVVTRQAGSGSPAARHQRRWRSRAARTRPSRAGRRRTAPSRAASSPSWRERYSGVCGAGGRPASLPPEQRGPRRPRPPRSARAIPSSGIGCGAIPSHASWSALDAGRGEVADPDQDVRHELRGRYTPPRNITGKNSGIADRRRRPRRSARRPRPAARPRTASAIPSSERDEEAERIDGHGTAERDGARRRSAGPARPRP